MIPLDDRDALLRMLDGRTPGSIADVDSSALAELLVHVMERDERGYPLLNEDRLASRAVRLRNAGCGSFLDAVVVGWLRSRPCAARLDIASVVLSYFWRCIRWWPSGHTSQATVDSALVDALLHVRDEVPHVDAADASSLFALGSALDAQLSPATRQRVLRVLVDAASREHAHPHVRDYVTQALVRAGEKSSNEVEP